jgi:hypothetical protein
MDRRTFVAAATAILGNAALTAAAQQARTVYRVGLIFVTSP